ncbi:MAG: lytic transglycosylase domain-containing protein [Rhizobiaceae bacterium]|nr:lytic transglycosylase domain-containing protein [Rhizobiaceae bacterium]
MSPSSTFLRSILIVTAAQLTAASLSGCTSSGGVAEQMQAAAEEEVALPDSVVAVPGERGEGLVLASYAGGTPSSPDTVFAPDGRFGPDAVAARSPELDALIARYADHYEVPERLVRRVVMRESTFNPAARNGPYWGLMQILPQTARTMGHRGSPEELLDAETNLKYAVRYLRGAYLTAGGDEDQAVRLYARGYYYDAKAAGLLDETGLGRDRRRMN